MTGEMDENNDLELDDEAVADESFEDTVVIETDVVETDIDNVGDMSVEINVEELVASIESADGDEIEHEREVRKRLEKIRERQDEDLDSTYNFNLDDDL